MIKEIKALTFNTLIYGAGHILARIVTFLLLPLYTNVFNPNDYGVISLAYTFMGFMSVVLHYGLDAALLKRYVQSDVSEKTGYLTSAWFSFLVTSIGFGLLITLLRSWLGPIILGSTDNRLMTLVGWIIALDIMWSIPQLIFRAEEKPYIYITNSLLNVLGSLTLNLLFVLKLGMGIYGVLLSNFIVSGSLFLLTLPAILKRIKSSAISVLAWKKMMRFGLPFLPSGIFAMIMELADRYILKEMTDLTTVGVYSAGYKLGMLMMLIVMGFNMGWQPFFLKVGGTTEQKPLFARITTYVLAILGFIWIILLVWVDDIVRIQLGSITVYGVAYWSSTNIVPWIALGYVFHGLYLLQLPGVFQQEKSIWVASTRAIGALSNIGLNIYLIPYYGAIGAAIATCISFMVMAVILFSVNRTLYPIAYEWSRLLRIAILMIAVYLLHVVSSHDLFVKVMLTLFYPVGLTMAGFLNHSERAWIRRSLNVWPEQSY